MAKTSKPETRQGALQPTPDADAGADPAREAQMPNADAGTGTTTDGQVPNAEAGTGITTDGQVPKAAMPALTRYRVVSPIRIATDRIDPGTDEDPVVIDLDPVTANALVAVGAIRAEADSDGASDDKE